MSDLFPILPSEPEPPRFDDAVREAIQRLEAAMDEFDALLESVPEDAYTGEEWRIIQVTADAVEKAAEMAEEGYLAVAYDSHAWYRIVENLERVAGRLNSALVLMRAARERGDELTAEAQRRGDEAEG